MRFFDRFTGEEVNEPSDLFLPGRYRLLEPMLLNGHTQLHVGCLLLDDGSGAVLVQDVEYRFISSTLVDQQQTDFELATEAVISIADKVENTDGTDVSPMLPAEITAQCDLQELEHDLRKILLDGHLHSISDRPRRDLRYDDLVAPVARARRLSAKAINHLASHSHCWQQRTTNGVQPKKVLARVSEDDFAIYENRLYVRLLDRVDQHLTKRLARINSVNSRMERVLEFQGSEKTHFRLRKEICLLWGKSYLESLTDDCLSNGNAAVKELESQLRIIRGLKQRGIYSLIRGAAGVFTQIHRTNILNHDPHYRHLPPLWEKLNDERDDGHLAPQELLKKHQHLQHAYVSYIGVVTRSALQRYDLQRIDERFVFRWAGLNFELTLESDDWIVSSPDGSSLRIVPIVWTDVSVSVRHSSKQDLVVCYLGSSSDIESLEQLFVSPMDLYSVEKLGKVIDEWMLRRMLKGYGRILGPIPTSCMQVIASCGENFELVSETDIRVLAPIGPSKMVELSNSLRASANSKLANDVMTAIRQISVLSNLCGHEARFKRQKFQDFSVECDLCQTSWALKSEREKRYFSIWKKGALAIPEVGRFEWSGRDWLKFEINK